MERDQGQQMTYEQIEAHVISANLEQFEKPQATGTEGAQADLAGQLQKVCGIYKVVRPILKAVLAIPLIPEVIKKPIRTFVTVMDSICPQ
jgi:hypothetical protein